METESIAEEGAKAGELAQFDRRERNALILMADDPRPTIGPTRIMRKLHKKGALKAGASDLGFVDGKAVWDTTYTLSKKGVMLAQLAKEAADAS